MEWGSTAYGWLRRGTGFVADTASVLWEGVKKIPEVSWSYIANPTARQVTRGFLHVLVEDLIPFVLLNQALNGFQQYVDDSYESDPGAWPAYFTLQAVNTIFQASFFLYKAHNAQRTLARSSVLALENNKAWSDKDVKLRKTEPFTICDEENCTSTRFAHGLFRGLGVFYLTQIAISLTRFIPYVGEYLSPALRIYSNGRFVLSSVLPEVCQRHNLNYQDSHRPIALALGLFHFGSVLSTSQIISYVTSLPADEVANLTDFLLLLPTTAVAARLDLPKPDDAKFKPREARSLTQYLFDHITDPLGTYERLMGWVFDVFLYGLKKKIPQLLKGKKNEIDWPDIEKQVTALTENPAIRFAKLLFISNIFHSIKRLNEDPVIKHFWRPLCLSIANIAEGAAEWGKGWIVSTATYNKTTTKLGTYFLKWWKGLPPSLSKIVGELIKDKYVQNWLISFANTLREETKDDKKLPDDFFLRQAQTFGQLLERVLQVNHDDAYETATLILDGMIWGAEPLQNQLKAKPKPAIENPLTEHKNSPKQTIILRDTRRPSRLFLDAEDSPRPSSQSIFKFDDKEGSPSANDREGLRLRFSSEQSHV